MTRAPLILASVALAATGCGDRERAADSTSSAPATTATATTVAETETAPPTAQLVVYRLQNGKLAPTRVSVSRTKSVAAAALDALGLDARVTIADGAARVERADATPAEVAQIVYTLTRYPTIRRVAVAGHTGLTRADVEEFAPPIVIESPLPGDTFDAREVTGTASVYEATLVVELVQGEKVVAKATVTASEGAPGRGTFAVAFPPTAGAAGPATVVAFSPSAADGSEQHRIAIPVTLR